MSEIKVVALTLMRKGSKRFPNKVLYPLFGKPLYKWTEEWALQLGYPYYLAHDYDKLDLCPETNEIKRKREYADDKHKTCEEIKSFNLDADWYLFLQVTSPLRMSIKQMKIAVDYTIRHKYDCLFSGYKIKPGYYYNDIEPINFLQSKRTDNGCFKFGIWKETGSIYFFNKKMLNKKHILDTYNKFIIEDPYDIDIDTREDIKGIENVYKNNS